MKKDFLLEIGCENLPSGYIEGALRQLDEMIRAGFGSERIRFDSIYLTGTPNRLVVHAKGVAGRQEPAVEQIIGPPASVAVAPDGSYTKAALGFAAKQGVGEKALSRVRTDRGEYLAVVRKIGGGPTRPILLQKAPVWIKGLKFPKVMRWGDEELRFARPIRWVMCFFGTTPLKLKVGRLYSVPSTRLSSYFEEMTPVSGIEDYFSVLDGNGIVLDFEKRRKMVTQSARKAAEKAGGRLVEDEELFSMVANLLESPVAMSGSFDRSFLALPREVIVTALKSHQRYFSIEDSRGKLKPGFVAFADGARKNRREILRGYERVLQARLADAEFYFKEDTSRPIGEMASKLKGIVWLEGLGDLSQKSERIGRISAWIQSMTGAAGKEEIWILSRAAALAKADLASEMVKDGKEFTLLQGYIGREYAKSSGEREEVAEAIYEHYFPRFSGDRLPEGAAGLHLSLADRFDTITGCFIQGLEPTGSQDPYALRRHAISILRMMTERRMPVSLPEAVDRSVGLFMEEGLVPPGKYPGALAEGIMILFTQRFSTMLRSLGYDYDLVSAVLSAPWEVPFAAQEMAASLQEMRKEGRLGDFVLGMKRITNIIPAARRSKVTSAAGQGALKALMERDEAALGFSSSLFRDKIEYSFLETAEETASKLVRLERPGELDKSFLIIGEMIPAINSYFDGVLVNCEEDAVRENRIAFLLALHRAFGVFCDYAAIAGE